MRMVVLIRLTVKEQWSTDANRHIGARRSSPVFPPRNGRLPRSPVVRELSGMELHITSEPDKTGDFPRSRRGDGG